MRCPMDFIPAADARALPVTCVPVIGGSDVIGIFIRHRFGGSRAIGTDARKTGAHTTMTTTFIDTHMTVN